MQQQIIKIQQELGFRYLRFHGMLDQELHIYQGMENGKVKCCFTYFDMVIDFVLEQGLRPFLEFSFIPRELAKAQTSIFETGSITAACADCTAFSALVEAILWHAICRYGWDEVSQWKFSTFQINYVFFDCMTMEEYLDLVIDCVSLLPPELVIHRITGDGPKALLIAPLWSANKRLVLNSLTRRFKERGVTQGCGLTIPSSPTETPKEIPSKY